MERLRLSDRDADDRLRMIPAPEVPEQNTRREQRERTLYPVFKQWLLLQGHDQVGKTAEQRNRDRGTWSNPYSPPYRFN